jgi:hypothetical protein
MAATGNSCFCGTTSILKSYIFQICAAIYQLLLQTVSEEMNTKKSANQKQESPVTDVFVNGSGQNEESSMEDPLCTALVSSRSINKHGRHRQLLFLQIKQTKTRISPDWNS